MVTGETGRFCAVRSRSLFFNIPFSLKGELVLKENNPSGLPELTGINLLLAFSLMLGNMTTPWKYQ